MQASVLELLADLLEGSDIAREADELDIPAMRAGGCAQA